MGLHPIALFFHALLYFCVIFLALLFVLCVRRNLFGVQIPAKASDKEETNTGTVPCSILEIQVKVPSRVIFSGEAIADNYKLSEFTQTSAVRLGEGTLGPLFKVVLNSGLIVTVRRLRADPARSPELDRWINFFGQMREKLLTPILLSFWYGKEVFIVYKYTCLGSLEELLHGREGIYFTALNWNIRRNIALFASLAVAGIHARTTSDGKGLICGVIKPSNVMICTDFSASLSGYETPYLSSSTMIIQRNPGRIAPEAKRSSVFEQKSDVYSFGVLLLELVTGRKPIVNNEDGEELDLVDYVRFKRKKEGLEGLYDKRIIGVEDDIVNMVGIAELCLFQDPKERPTMERVATMIQQLRG